MLIEVDSKNYKHYFPSNPHPFISEQFIELNKSKTERVIRLVENKDKREIGLVAGIKDEIIKSPFSAPFGGFHFRNDVINISEIDSFLNLLKSYVKSQGLKKIEIILPPDIYHLTFNTKTVNSLIRNGFQSNLPDITAWVNLQQFNGTFTQRNSREYYRQAVRNGLSFHLVNDEEEKTEIYSLIKENREKFGRPIFMTLTDVQNTGNLWPTDFFKVITSEKIMVASAIFYRFHPDICYALFWGDNETGRPLRAMDFIAYNLWTYYKDLGFKFIDLGISTEAGIPNEGLLRFKESHDSTSSLKYRFFWNNTIG